VPRVLEISGNALIRCGRRLNPDPKARVDEPQPCIEQDLNFIVDKYYRG